MKKQLLIAAVAATMATVSIADVSITGNAAMNYTNLDNDDGTGSNIFKHDVDLTVVGKNGDSSMTMTVSNENQDDDNAYANTNAALEVETVKISTKVSGINLSMGQWVGSDSNLSDGGSSETHGRFSADTTINGVKVQFEDQNASNASVTISGTIAGAKISHEVFQTSTETKISGDVVGISVAYHGKDDDTNTSDMTAFEVSKEFNGVTATYAQAEQDSAAGVAGTMDGDAFLDYTNQQKAVAFGVATSIAGNNVAVTRLTTNASTTAVDVDSTEVVITRPLASGATFEATYTDTDSSTSLDLELAVKF